MSNRVYRTLHTLLMLVICVCLAMSGLAGDREPAPRFNAKTTAGEKFTND